jgi:hypothetical protein
MSHRAPVSRRAALKTSIFIGGIPASFIIDATAFGYERGKPVPPASAPSLPISFSPVVTPRNEGLELGLAGSF